MDLPTCPDHPHAGPVGCYGCLVCEGEALAAKDKRNARPTKTGGHRRSRGGMPQARQSSPVGTLSIEIGGQSAAPSERPENRLDAITGALNESIDASWF